MSTEIYRCTSPTIRVDDCGDELEPGNLLPVLLCGGAQMYFAGHIHLYEKSKYQAMHFITSGATSYDLPDFKKEVSFWRVAPGKKPPLPPGSGKRQD